MPSELARQRLCDIRDNIGHVRDFIGALSFDESPSIQKRCARCN